MYLLIYIHTMEKKRSKLKFSHNHGSDKDRVRGHSMHIVFTNAK